MEFEKAEFIILKKIIGHNWLKSSNKVILSQKSILKNYWNDK